MAILFRSFGFVDFKHFYIILLSNLSYLSVPGEVYSRKALCALKDKAVYEYSAR
jgi:hypothetical protein